MCAYERSRTLTAHTKSKVSVSHAKDTRTDGGAPKTHSSFFLFVLLNNVLHVHASRRRRDGAVQPISVRGFHGASFVGSLFRTRLCLAYRVVMDAACYVLHVRTCCACAALCGSVVVGVSCVCLGAFCVPLRFRPVCGFVCVRRAYLNVTGGQCRKENGISAAESLEMASAAVLALAFHEKRCSSRFDT